MQVNQERRVWAKEVQQPNGKVVLKGRKSQAVGRYSRRKEAVTASRGEVGGPEVREMRVSAVWGVGPQGMTELLGRVSGRK